MIFVERNNRSDANIVRDSLYAACGHHFINVLERIGCDPSVVLVAICLVFFNFNSIMPNSSGEVKGDSVVTFERGFFGHKCEDQ